MIKLPVGFYLLDINFYSSNAEIYRARLMFDFYAEEQTKNGKWKTSGSMFLFGNKAVTSGTQEESGT